MWEDLVHKIHEMPEQTRKIAAGFSIAAAGILTIVVMFSHINSQLAGTVDTEAMQEPSMGTMADATAPTPVQGIAESLGSLQKLLSSQDTAASNPGLVEKTKELAGEQFAAFERGFLILWNYFEVK